MPKRSLWKLLCISFFAFLVVACKPIASFSVSPDPVQAGVEATFDASSTVIYNKPKNNAAKSYAWDFGDGATGTGKVATHTYAAAGTFKVKLTVVDTAGRVGTTTENLVVGAGDVVDPTTTSLKVITQIAGGVALSGAEVTVGNAVGTSDANGLAALDAAPVGEDQVVTIKKAGYITQVVRKTLAADTEDQQMLVLLMPEKDTLSIADIAAAQTINSNYLGASLTLPANAFIVEATGAPAVGAATLKLTPWDISGIDLQAMPGNGRALDASGALVDLISAGMMSVEFFDATGNKLQVAAQKSVDIQMDLPAGTTSIGGNAIAEGTSIPMWFFDEARGIWVEEGVGTAVAKDSGLAVSASVGHFSTWGFSYRGNNTTSINFSCVTAGNATTPCLITADITFPDGSKSSANTWSNGGVVTLFVPMNVAIQWTATTANGLIGTAASPTGNTNSVFITVAPPTTTTFVQCQLPDSTPSPCLAVVSTTQPDGSVASTSRYIPISGAQLITNLSAAGGLQWTATAESANGSQWTTYVGNAVSNATESLIIPLTAQSQSSGKTLFVQCVNNFEGNPFSGAIGCSIEIRLTLENGTFETIESDDDLSEIRSFTLPPSSELTSVEIRGSSGGSDWQCFKSVSWVYRDLTNNQNIVLDITDRCFYL